MTCSYICGTVGNRTFQGHEPYEILVTSIILMDTKSSDGLLGGKEIILWFNHSQEMKHVISS
jgi:hypothetical protein